MIENRSSPMRFLERKIAGYYNLFYDCCRRLCMGSSIFRNRFFNALELHEIQGRIPKMQLMNPGKGANII